MSRSRSFVVGLVGGFALAACGDNHALPDACPSCVLADAAHDAAPHVDAPTDADPLRPATLAGTGLCVDDACTQINPDVHEYAPQWVLWADGATKRRWIYLPASTTIDTTTDPDYWEFPVGTKIWKEFSQDGAKVETRFLERVGSAGTTTDWFYMPYQWNEAGTATMQVPDGVMGANGTIHDIPSQGQCLACHNNTPNKVLGFGALMLDYAAGSGLLDLDGTNALGWLDAAPPGGSTPHYPLPTTTDRRARGARGRLPARELQPLPQLEVADPRHHADGDAPQHRRPHRVDRDRRLHEPDRARECTPAWSTATRP